MEYQSATATADKINSRLGFKRRVAPKSNYSAIFVNGQTLRLYLDPSKPITELAYPEFYDVGINSYCSVGCPDCYTDARKTGVHFNQIVEKLLSFFGNMTLNERPFQVALGGSGEATAHPDFLEVLKTFVQLGIVPNYTTSGSHLTDEIIAATKQYCGGIAISLHPHVEPMWTRALNMALEAKLRTNVHVVLSDRASIDRFYDQFLQWGDLVEYFVLLPYRATGRARPAKTDEDYLDTVLDKTPSSHRSKLAFGSGLYDFLCRNKHKYDCSLYPPEIMSKYIIFNNKGPDDLPSVYNNSFDLKPVAFSYETGCELGKANSYN
jgi:MoaA/NifB/PqqE/SkfB family radical SAM enzyme